MSSSPKHVRSSTYRVSNEPRQQRILRAIERVGDASITAHGTNSDGEFFVVASCASATADMHVRRIVISLDLSATRVTTPEPLYDDGRPSTPYLLGLTVPRLVLAMLRKIV